MFKSALRLFESKVCTFMGLKHLRYVRYASTNFYNERKDFYNERKDFFDANDFIIILGISN